MHTVTDTHSNRTLHSVSASTSPRGRPRPALVLTPVAASTMSLEESPMSARARSMALARALLERSHQGLDEIPRPTALGAANGVSNGRKADQEVCWAASRLVLACTSLLSTLARPLARVPCCDAPELTATAFAFRQHVFRLIPPIERDCPPPFRTRFRRRFSMR